MVFSVGCKVLAEANLGSVAWVLGSGVFGQHTLQGV